MKSILILILASFIICSTAFSDSPSNIKVDYQGGREILKIMVEHNSDNPAKHYIKRIVVELNKKKIIEQVFQGQSDESGLTVSYNVPGTKKGDKYIIYAYCNIRGKKKIYLTIR